MEAILFIDNNLLSSAQKSVFGQLLAITYYRKYLNELTAFYARLDIELRMIYSLKNEKVDKKYLSVYKKTAKKIKQEINNITFHLNYLNNQLIELAAADIINEITE